MGIDIIVIFLSCSFVDVLVEVVASRRDFICVLPLGRSGMRALARGSLEGGVEVA